jgi:hypothetical protein
MRKMEILFLVLLWWLSSFLVQAGIDGLTNVCAGSTQTYFAILQPGLSVDRWIVVGGTISGPNNGSSVIIIWSNGSSGTLTLRKKNADRVAFIDDISVNFYVGGIAASSNSSVCAGSSTTLSVNGNHNTVSYWQVSTNGGNTWSTIASSGSDPFTYTNLTTPSIFRAVSADCSSNLISSTVGVGIITSTGGGTLTGPGGICFGQSGTISLSGHAPEVILRWWRKIGDGPWEAIGVLNRDDPNQSIYTDVTTSYRAETSGSCGNRFSNEITVMILQIPAVTASDKTVCSGASTNILLLNGVSGTTFSWTQMSSNVSGATNGTGDVINQTLTNNVPMPGTVTYVVTPTSAAGCAGASRNIVVTVNPVPVITSSASQLSPSVCSGTALDFTPTSTVTGVGFSWTSSASGFISGISASGTGAITNTPVNIGNTNGSVNYSITPAAYGCTGATVSYFVTVMPLPIVNVSTSTQTSCSGQAMASVSISNPNGVSGTTFSWTVSAPSITGATSGYGAILSQILTNATNTDQTATYAILPTANGCTGTAASHTVMVKPIPTADVSLSTQLICTGQPMTSIAITNPNSVNGTTFSWTVSAPNITGATSGYGTILSQILTNATNTDQTAIYTVIPTANGCTGTSVNHFVNVKPTPTLSSSLNTPAIASRSLFNYTPSSAIVGTTFAWSRALIAGIAEVASSGTGSVSETLSNTTANAITVVYVFISSANGCSSTQNVSVVVTPPLYPNENYIIANSVLVSGITDGALIESLSLNHRSQTIQYFDGFGRPIQSVATKGSLSGTDMVQPIAYDPFGRESKKYLPYVSTETNGWYKPTALTEQAAFYNAPPPKVIQDPSPFSETVFEPSPLNRPLKQGAPGAAWQPNADIYSMADHTVKKRYELNTAGEVYLFRYDHVSGMVSLPQAVAEKYYQPSQLYANKTFDEHNNDITEYVDKEGRTVCKKVKASATEYASTYYIYDDLGNLVVVLPPEAVKKIIGQ